MRFQKHFLRADRPHAFFSASKYSWLNYDEDKMIESIMEMDAKRKGTELHDLAYRLIKHGQRLPDLPQTLNMYVNDAIGYRMTPEQVLIVNEWCYGTTDAISFRENLLRIHDYKSGVTPASFKQLIIYAAMFCMEYGFSPFDIRIELRIYQSNEVMVQIAAAEDVAHAIAQIKWGTKLMTDVLGEDVA